MNAAVVSSCFPPLNRPPCDACAGPMDPAAHGNARSCSPECARRLNIRSSRRRRHERRELLETSRRQISDPLATGRKV